MAESSQCAEASAPVRELETQLPTLFSALVKDADFFAFPSTATSNHFLPIIYHTEQRTTPTITGDAPDTAIEIGVGLHHKHLFIKRHGHTPFSWAEFFGTATWLALKDVKLSHRLNFERHPCDSILKAGGTTICDEDPDPVQCWAVDSLVKSPGHWSCIVWDSTAWYDEGRQEKATVPYGLCSELIVLIGLLCRQMEQNQDTSGVHQGPVKATAVTFTPLGARVLQASCDPLAAPAYLTLTFRGTYDPKGDPTTGYSPESTRNILR